MLCMQKDSMCDFRSQSRGCSRFVEAQVRTKSLNSISTCLTIWHKVSKEVKLIVDGTHLFLQHSTTLTADSKGSRGISLDLQGSFANE